MYRVKNKAVGSARWLSGRRFGGMVFNVRFRTCVNGFGSDILSIPGLGLWKSLCKFSYE